MNTMNTDSTQPQKNTTRPSRNQRSADSLVRAKLASGKEHADKAVRASEKSSRDATIFARQPCKVHKRFSLSAANGEMTNCCPCMLKQAANLNLDPRTLQFYVIWGSAAAKSRHKMHRSVAKFVEIQFCSGDSRMRGTDVQSGS